MKKEERHKLDLHKAICKALWQQHRGQNPSKYMPHTGAKELAKAKARAGTQFPEYERGVDAQP